MSQPPKVVLDQPASEQATLTERIPSVAVAILSRFFVQIKGL
jgi:hypothetical protein